MVDINTCLGKSTCFSKAFKTLSFSLFLFRILFRNSFQWKKTTETVTAYNCSFPSAGDVLSDYFGDKFYPCGGREGLGKRWLVPYSVRELFKIETRRSPCLPEKVSPATIIPGTIVAHLRRRVKVPAAAASSVASATLPRRETERERSFRYCFARYRKSVRIIATREFREIRRRMASEIAS